MTEYDFSEEGYQKYLRTQARVSHWVHEQSGRAPEYRNPFTYAPTSNSVRDEREYASAPPHGRIPSGGTIERSPTLSRPHMQPTHARGHPMPRSQSPPVQTSGHEARHTRSRSQPRSVQPVPYPQQFQYIPPQYPYQPSPPPHPPYYSGSRHRSPPPPMAIVPPHYAHGPALGPSMAYNYYDPQREVVLPIRHGERYTIVPQNGRQVIVQRGASPSSSRTSPSSAGQTKGPLLKRLIKNLTPTIEWRESASGAPRRSSSTRTSHGRRLTR